MEHSPNIHITAEKKRQINPAAEVLQSYTYCANQSDYTHTMQSSEYIQSGISVSECYVVIILIRCVAATTRRNARGGIFVQCREYVCGAADCVYAFISIPITDKWKFN